MVVWWCQLTIRDDVAEVLGAHARPDRGPGVGLGPRQLARGRRGDWEILLPELHGINVHVMG